MKYSERYGRPLRRPSDTLRETLLNYAWPGNVRELENVIKRFVILQDEGLVLAELKRARPSRLKRWRRRARMAAAAGAAAVATAPPPPATYAAARRRRRRLPRSNRRPPISMATRPRRRSPPTPGAVSLPELAREAAMKAERAAIQQALDRFRWNRRKAADFLGVSYKTLLNKMKECGISEQQAVEGSAFGQPLYKASLKAGPSVPVTAPT